MADATDSIVFHNGQWRPLHEAMLSVEDRGVMFGDGVYEVVRVYDGWVVADEAHENRMRCSLAGMGINAPAALDRFRQITLEILKRNLLSDATVYWQITRGACRRNHVIDGSFKPTTFAIS